VHTGKTVTVNCTKMRFAAWLCPDPMEDRETDRQMLHFSLQYNYIMLCQCHAVRTL